MRTAPVDRERKGEGDIAGNPTDVQRTLRLIGIRRFANEARCYKARRRELRGLKTLRALQPAVEIGFVDPFQGFRLFLSPITIPLASTRRFSSEIVWLRPFELLRGFAAGYNVGLFLSSAEAMEAFVAIERALGLARKIDNTSFERELPPGGHRVAGIYGQVQNDLRDLARIGLHIRAIFFLMKIADD